MVGRGRIRDWEQGDAVVEVDSPNELHLLFLLCGKYFAVVYHLLCTRAVRCLQSISRRLKRRKALQIWWEIQFKEDIPTLTFRRYFTTLLCSSYLSVSYS